MEWKCQRMVRAEMPIWGADFLARDKMNEKQVASRIDQLTDYLKSIQAK